jgi:hypothetical protein
MASVQPRFFIHFAQEAVFSCSVNFSIQLFSLFNFKPHSFFPFHYGPNNFCRINWSLGGMWYLPLPHVKQFSLDIASWIRKWAEYPPYSHRGAGCFEEYLMNFVANLLESESAAICLLRRTNGLRITAANLAEEIRIFRGFWTGTCDLFSSMPIFLLLMVRLQVFSSPALYLL